MLLGVTETKARIPSTSVTQLGPGSMGSPQGHPPPTTLEQGINDVPELPFTDFERKWAVSNVRLRLAVILFSVANVAGSIALWAAPVDILEPALTLPLVRTGCSLFVSYVNTLHSWPRRANLLTSINKGRDWNTMERDRALPQVEARREAE